MDPAYLDMLKTSSERHRRRFYEGEYVDDVAGTLWTMTLLEKCRISRHQVPDLKRVVIAIDPAVSTNESSNETGIIAAGVDRSDKAYILEDGTGKYNPTEWAAKALLMYEAHQADCIVAETNQGGAMVEATIRQVNRNVKYRGDHASRGKITRAEPISAAYEAGRVFHAGDFAELEEEMTSYVAGGVSPDQMDAAVWALTELLSRGPDVYPMFGTYIGICDSPYLFDGASMRPNPHFEGGLYILTDWWKRGDLYGPGDHRWRLPDGQKWVAAKIASGEVTHEGAKERGWIR